MTKSLLLILTLIILSGCGGSSPPPAAIYPGTWEGQGIGEEGEGRLIDLRLVIEYESFNLYAYTLYHKEDTSLTYNQILTGSIEGSPDNTIYFHYLKYAREITWMGVIEGDLMSGSYYFSSLEPDTYAFELKRI